MLEIVGEEALEENYLNIRNTIWSLYDFLQGSCDMVSKKIKDTCLLPGDVQKKSNNGMERKDKNKISEKNLFHLKYSAPF